MSEIRSHLDAVFRAESGRILATLTRLLGGFDLAEDAMHDAFNAALQRWPVQGLPANPRVGLISTARFKAIDAIRRRARFDASQDYIAARCMAMNPPRAPSMTNCLTTGSSSSSPAVTRRLRPTLAQRSHCAKCAG